MARISRQPIWKRYAETHFGHTINTKDQTSPRLSLRHSHRTSLPFSLQREHSSLPSYDLSALHLFVMPALDEVSYSREATIAAFRDYYRFLTEMFLPEDRVKEPRAGGWPAITKDNSRLLGKNDGVFELIRHLPYVAEETLLAPYARVGNWPFLLGARLLHQRPFDDSDVEGTRIITEGLDWENVPPSAFDVTRDDVTFILDTQFGVVHWLETPRGIYESTAREPIIRDFDDCTPENEHEWRHSTA